MVIGVETIDVERLFREGVGGRCKKVGEEGAFRNIARPTRLDGHDCIYSYRKENYPARRDLIEDYTGETDSL